MFYKSIADSLCTHPHQPLYTYTDHLRADVVVVYRLLGKERERERDSEQQHETCQNKYFLSEITKTSDEYILAVIHL